MSNSQKSSMTKDAYLHYWYQALSSPFGVEIACTDAATIQAHLYRARQEARDTDLTQIKVTVSPFDPTRVWLVKKEPQHETP